MNLVKMKTPSGQLMSRIPETDVDYHMKNGWKMVEEMKASKPSKQKKELKAEVQVDLDLDLNEENE